MRHILLILLLVGLAAFTGCRMCAHPFDDCGPTYLDECGAMNCNPLARSGSVLSPPLGDAGCGSPTGCSCNGTVAPATDANLEPIPLGEMTVLPEETPQVVPLPMPQHRQARGGRPKFLR